MRRRKDGTLIDVALTVSPIKNSRGQVAAASSIARDISERRAVENELRRGRAVLQSLFDSLPGLFLVLTPDLNIVSVSDAYLTATMTKREDLLGRGIFEVFPDNPDEPGATGSTNLRASFERVRVTRMPDTMAIQKYDIRRPDGVFEERYWSPINSPVLGADQQIEYFIHRVEDVTEFLRQKAQSGDTAAPADARGANGSGDVPELAAVAGRQPTAAGHQPAVRASQSGGGSRQPGQEHVSVDHVARNPHADERHSRLRPVDVAGSERWERTRKRISRSSAAAASICWPSSTMFWTCPRSRRAARSSNPSTFNLSRLLDDLAAMFRLRAEAKALRLRNAVRSEKPCRTLWRTKARSARC